MNAQQSVVAIEQMTIVHEGIYQIPFVGLAAAGAGLLASQLVPIRRNAMDVEIGEISSTVRLTDGAQPSAQSIARAVLAIIEAHKSREKDLEEERRVGTGVRDAQEREV